MRPFKRFLWVFGFVGFSLLQPALVVRADQPGPSAISPFAEEAVSQLAIPVRSGEGADVVAKAIQLLTRMKTREALPVIAALMDAEHPWVAYNAVWSLEHWARRKWGAEAAAEQFEFGSGPIEGWDGKGKGLALRKAVENAKAWWAANKDNLDEAIKAAEVGPKAEAAAVEAAVQAPTPPRAPRMVGAAPMVRGAAQAPGGVRGALLPLPVGAAPARIGQRSEDAAPVREAPLSPEEADKVQSLLAGLSDPHLETRRAALDALLALGRGVLEHLPASSDDAEAAARIEELRRRFAPKR